MIIEIVINGEKRSVPEHSTVRSLLEELCGPPRGDCRGGQYGGGTAHSPSYHSVTFG